MNDIRRTILWVIFGFSLVMLWDKWQIHNGNKATFFPAPPAQTASAPAATATGAGTASVPAPSATPAVAAQPPTGGPAPVVASTRERISVSTDVLRLAFDTEGASLVHGELLKYPESASDAKPFLLLDESGNRVYVAQTGLIGGAYPTHKTPMAVVPGARELKDGEQ